MFVFAFEGALLAFIVNGDRFVLLALLPRRKPRTDGSVQPPYHSLFKELNLTTGGYYPSRVPFSRWHGFLCIVAVAPLPYINPRQSCLRFTIFYRAALTRGGFVFAPPFSRRARLHRAAFVVALSRSSVFVCYSVMRQQVPKPMSVDADEGAELAPSANGDRLEAPA